MINMKFVMMGIMAVAADFPNIEALWGFASSDRPESVGENLLSDLMASSADWNWHIDKMRNMMGLFQRNSGISDEFNAAKDEALKAISHSSEGSWLGLKKGGHSLKNFADTEGREALHEGSKLVKEGARLGKDKVRQGIDAARGRQSWFRRMFWPKKNSLVEAKDKLESDLKSAKDKVEGIVSQNTFFWNDAENSFNDLTSKLQLPFLRRAGDVLKERQLRLEKVKNDLKNMSKKDLAKVSKANKKSVQDKIKALEGQVQKYTKDLEEIAQKSAEASKKGISNLSEKATDTSHDIYEKVKSTGSRRRLQAVPMEPKQNPLPHSGNLVVEDEGEFDDSFTEAEPIIDIIAEPQASPMVIPLGQNTPSTPMRMQDLLRAFFDFFGFRPAQSMPIVQDIQVKQWPSDEENILANSMIMHSTQPETQQSNQIQPAVMPTPAAAETTTIESESTEPNQPSFSDNGSHSRG